MAIKFYTLNVSKVNKETSDTISITFDVPDNIREEFSYKHGQYITIKLPVEGSDNRRAYSISASPVTDRHLTITVKKVDDGIVSRYINDNIKAGDKIEVMPPLGNFTIDLSPLNTNNYVLIGAGSGITPLMSILKTILSVEFSSRVYLIYQNRNEESIIFKGQLDELQTKYDSRLIVSHILSRPSESWIGEKGRVDSQFIEKFISANLGNNVFKAHYFICGPDGLMLSSDNALRNLKVASYQIHKEIFTIPVKSIEEEDSNIVLKADSNEIITRKVKIILYSEEHEFLVEPDETVLTAAQREGEDPPFSCQIGACSTCRAKLVSGKVFMDERDSLTDEEIEEGYVLTCQAHPLTDDVVIDYDD
jgi:ring-1,2-phenylacetyl-CoA epoxidase subunit PaaE